MSVHPCVRVLNGPNLNLLGMREPGVYGSNTLTGLEQRCRDRADALGLALEFHQTNHEGELVELVQGARHGCHGLVVNAGAYTHTSVALLDALRAVNFPVVEVHLSNVFQREAFRHHSYVAPVAIGVIAGFGPDGYGYALDALAVRLRGERTT